jgi:glycosyltransferase 2 family protein
MNARHKTIIKAVVGLALLAALIRMVDWRATLATLKNISLPWIVVLLLLSYVLVLISCIKWRLFLAARGVSISLRKLTDLYFIGYFFNNFAPSNVGGDIVRSYILGEHIGSQSNSFGTVFLERFTGIVALNGLAVLAAVIRPELLANRILQVLMAGMALGLGLILLLILSRSAQQWASMGLQRLPAKAPVEKLKRFIDVIFYFQAHRAIMVQAMLLSVLFHLFTIVNTQAACWALGLQVHFLDLAVVVPVVLMVAAIPISMNALGIMEGAFVYFLGLAGLDAASALSVALVLRAKNILLALLGGGLFLRWGQRVRRRKNKEAFHDR